MFEQLSSFYSSHPRTRQVAPLFLVGGAVVLYSLTGGFPPRAWMYLIDTTPQLGYLWDTHGPMILLPFALMLLISLTWLAGWGAFLWSGIGLAFQWIPGRRGSRNGRAIQAADFNWPSTQREYGEPTYKLPETFPSYSPRKEAPTQGIPTVSLWDSEFTLTTEVGVGWDVGKVRYKNPNEDNVLTLQGTCPFEGRLLPFSLFIVADGMGGHANGREASRIAVQRLTHAVLYNLLNMKQLSEAALIGVLLQGVQQANKAVYQRANELGVGMGTTVTAVLVVEKIAYVVNVGDSRTYLYRPANGLSQVTRDHSVVAQMVEEGRLAAEDIYTHPDRNQVYRGLGDQSVVEVDWFTVQLQVDDYLLLCSDGLWEMVRDREIERIMQRTKAQPAHVSAMLVQAAQDAGGVDNISIVVVHAIPAVSCKVR